MNESMRLRDAVCFDVPPEAQGSPRARRRADDRDRAHTTHRIENDIASGHAGEGEEEVRWWRRVRWCVSEGACRKEGAHMEGACRGEGVYQKGGDAPVDGRRRALMSECGRSGVGSALRKGMPWSRLMPRRSSPASVSWHALTNEVISSV